MPNASAYSLTVNQTKTAVSSVSFGFDVPMDNPVILYNFQKFELPNMRDVVDECAELICNITDSKGKLLTQVRFRLYALK